MRAARFVVDPEALRDVMSMPTTSRFVGAGMTNDGRGVYFIVDDPTLPEADEVHNCLPTARRVEWEWNIQ